jgi:hypothetical protein
MRHLKKLRCGTRALFEPLWWDFGIQNHTTKEGRLATECSSAKSAGQVPDQGSPEIRDTMNITHF